MALRVEDAAVPTPADFDAFYALHASRVRALIRRRVRHRHVDDLVQETFLRAFRNAGSFDHDRPAWPWLAAIATNVAIDFSRRRSTTAEEPTPIADRRPAPGADPAEHYARSERREAIVTTLASLPERQRRVLLLREMEALHYDELAEHEGLSADAVKSLLKRARESFRTTYTALAREKGLLGAVLLPVRFGADLVERVKRAVAPRAANAGSRAQALTSFTELASVSLVALAATAMSVIGVTSDGGASPVAGSGARVPAASSRMPALAGGGAGAAGGSAVVHLPAGSAPAAPGAAQPRAAARVAVDASGETLYERDHLKVSAFGQRVVELEGTTWTSCTANAVRRIACDAIDALPEDIAVG